jgi:AraC-like DNA-binding protein
MAETAEYISDAGHPSSRLLRGLGRFRAPTGSGTIPHGESMFSYCALRWERLLAIELEHPVLGIVLAGRKEIWRGLAVDALSPGSVFVLPRGVMLDVLNIPGERTGSYQSLVLEIRGSDLPDLAPPPGPAAGGLSVPLDEDLVDAVLHAAASIADGPARGTLRASRLTELLALLHDVPEARPLYERTMSDRVARLVQGDLGHGWTAAEVAVHLAVSESTLRRRLAEDGVSFSALLRRARMVAAQRHIAAGAGSQVAGLAVGYASRAHFARAYRSVFGANPSETADSGAGAPLALVSGSSR